VPRGIQGFFVWICLAELCGGANCGNLPIPDEDSAIRDDTQATELESTLGWTGKGKQLGGRMNQHVRLLII
jgi:hypothetical protein